MNRTVLGALLGLLFAAGVLLAVRAAPPMRPIRLADRLAPYLGDAPPPSKLLARPSATSTPFAVLRRLFGPVIGEAVGFLDRVVGGSVSVRRRLGGLGHTTSLDDFRVEQVVWGALGMIGGGLFVVLIGVLRGGVDVVLAGGAAVVGLVGGVLARDWYLTRQVQQREAAMLSEFPVVADLLALSVVAGEAPPDALLRVCRLTGGELARDLDAAASGRRPRGRQARAAGGRWPQGDLDDGAGRVPALARHRLVRALPGIADARLADEMRKGGLVLPLDMLAAWLAGACARVRGRDPERGDVPGWVMVTVMTAGLVVVIFAVFKGKITDAVSSAIDSVTGKTK